MCWLLSSIVFLRVCSFFLCVCVSSSFSLNYCHHFFSSHQASRHHIFIYDFFFVVVVIVVIRVVTPITICMLSAVSHHIKNVFHTTSFSNDQLDIHIIHICIYIYWSIYVHVFFFTHLSICSLFVGSNFFLSLSFSRHLRLFCCFLFANFSLCISLPVSLPLSRSVSHFVLRYKYNLSSCWLKAFIYNWPYAFLSLEHFVDKFKRISIFFFRFFSGELSLLIFRFSFSRFVSRNVLSAVSFIAVI